MPDPKDQNGGTKLLKITILGLIVLLVIAVVIFFEKPQSHGLLNLETISVQIVQGEKSEQATVAAREIAEILGRMCGKKWDYENALPKGDGAKHEIVPGEVRLYTAKKPFFSGSPWYRISIDRGIVIEAAEEEGFEQAAEHLAELLVLQNQQAHVTRGVFTSGNRNKNLSNEQVYMLSSIRDKAETVIITGRVTMPDESPAVETRIDIRSIAFTINDNPFRYTVGSPDSIPRWGTCRTDENGHFEFEAPPGCILILSTKQEGSEGNLVSNMECFTPSYFSNPPVELKLRPGVPVTVKAKCEDGSAADAVNAVWKRSFPPPMKIYGNENLSRNNHEQGYGQLIDGEHTFYLTPGEYELFFQNASGERLGKTETVTIIDGEHYEFDCTIPAPVRVRLLHADGQPLVKANVTLLHTRDSHLPFQQDAQTVTVQTDENGIVPVYLWSESNYVFAMSEDKRFGIIRAFSHGEAGKTIDVSLEKTTEISATVIDSRTRNPLPNVEFRCDLRITTLRSMSSPATYSTSFNAVRVTTNDQGKALFYLPPIPSGDVLLEYERPPLTPFTVPKTTQTVELEIEM